MNLTEYSLANRKVTYFSIVLIICAGISAFLNLGQLEDPEFSIKSGVISTHYPGASPEEVEQEVTDKIEIALQQMPEVEHLYSVSKAGHSMIKVDLKQEYWSDRLPQVWDVLRKKVVDMENQLPPGAKKPKVVDDFGAVYGFLLAVSSDEYDYAELEKITKTLKKNLSLVDGVSRVELWGVQPKAVYLAMSEQAQNQRNVSPAVLAQVLQQQNSVVNSGFIENGTDRLRVEIGGTFSDPTEIGELIIPQHFDGKEGALLRIKDVAKITVDYVQPAMNKLRINGEPALAIAIANQQGGNVVKTGKALDEELKRLQGTVPVGVEISKIAWQSETVETSVDGFMISLVEAVIIVLIVLTLPMGWRMGIIIGSSLVLTILATFIVMAVLKIDLQRMSLGALIIALGMMVDNAIVVADGMYERISKGMSRKKAAIESARLPAGPLLGATIVAVIAFYPIYASNANAGEYCRTLFIVVGVSLMISWIIAMTVTPLQCMDLLKVSPKSDTESESQLMMWYKKLLIKALKSRFLFISVMIMLLGGSGVGFQHVSKMFFPESSRAQFMVDLWHQPGTRIQTTSDNMVLLEQHLLKDNRIQSVSSFVGMGPPRFYLPVDSEPAASNYGQLIVNVKDWKEIPAMTKQLDVWMQEKLPNVLTRTRKYGIGPADTWQFEARLIGTAHTTTEQLQQKAQELMAVLKNSPLAKNVRTDSQGLVKKLHIDYDQSRGILSGITRSAVANTTRQAHDGITVGLYREQDDLFPIIVRATEQERQNTLDLSLKQIYSDTGYQVPVGQVSKNIQLGFEENAIIRWDRHRAITVQAVPNGVTFPQLFASVKDEIESIELPPGWKLYWDGEKDSTGTAQKSLIPGVVPALVIMLFILVALFNNFRPPLLIVLTLPFAFIGVSTGLLTMGASFGFMALLGAMSLSGMLIKNAIVLLDQIDIEIRSGKDAYNAVLDSCASRLRPVVLAAGTTVLGVVPLLQDVFWVSMSVTIMYGLAFGTILTMFLIPVLYCMFYRIKS